MAKLLARFCALRPLITKDITNIQIGRVGGDTTRKHGRDFRVSHLVGEEAGLVRAQLARWRARRRQSAASYAGAKDAYGGKKTRAAIDTSEFTGWGRKGQNLIEVTGLSIHLEELE